MNTTNKQIVTRAQGYPTQYRVRLSGNSYILEYRDVLTSYTNTGWNYYRQYKNKQDAIREYVKLTQPAGKGLIDFIVILFVAVCILLVFGNLIAPMMDTILKPITVLSGLQDGIR